MIFQNRGIFGPDVSFYQDNNYTPQQIDFNKMRDYGASFVIIKCGQRNYLDQDWKYNWSESKEAGLPRSAYWFCDEYLSGPEQALTFWNAVKDDQPEGMLFADFEGGSWTHWTQLYNFLSELKKLSGYSSDRIGIYTGYYFWVNYGPRTLAQKQWFSQFPLWLAWYTLDPSTVNVPDTWAECLLWQQGTPAIGIDMGVESLEIDYNVFNGDAEKFERYFNAKPAIPSEGDKMILYYADLVSGGTSNVRAAPNGAIIGTITGPVTVSIVSEKVNTGGYDWYEISFPVQGWIALTSRYSNFVPASPVPVGQKPIITVTLEAEGYPTVSYEWKPLE